MKTIASSLIVLALAAIAPTANAQTVTDTEISPFNVVSLAYQGRLANDGIPGYGGLESGIQSGSITAEVVINAAIEAGRLPEAAERDTEFVTAVDLHLNNLVDRN